MKLESFVSITGLMNESKKVNGTGMVPDVLENPCLCLNRFHLKQRQAFLVRRNLKHPLGVLLTEK